MKRPEVYVVLVGDEDNKRVHCVAKGPAIAKRIADELQGAGEFKGMPYQKWYALQYKLNSFCADNDLDDDDLSSSDGELIKKYIDEGIDPDTWNDASEFYKNTDPDLVEIVKVEMYNR